MIYTPFRTFKNPFEAPILQVRDEHESKHFTDAKDIFHQVKIRLDHLSLKDASKLFNDLAFVIIPFDKTQ